MCNARSKTKEEGVWVQMVPSPSRRGRTGDQGAALWLNLQDLPRFGLHPRKCSG